MKNHLFRKGGLPAAAICAVMAGLMAVSCTSEEKYDTAVTKDIALTCDGTPWTIYFGTANKNMFIYNADGTYNSNLSVLYPLNLYRGSYRIVAIDQTDLLSNDDNIGKPLDQVFIPQDSLAKTRFAVSAPTDYASPSDGQLRLDMTTRTGLLRLRATDVKADKRYAGLRATVTSPVTGYNVGSATFAEGRTTISKERSTNNGGIGYGEDFTLLETATNGKSVTVSIDYLDGAGKVLWTKDIDGAFPVPANDTVQISFALNNAGEPMIQHFTVQVASQGWNDVDLTPGAPVVVPEGFTYVSPSDNINDVFNALKADPSVSEIKLYLKAGAQYAFDKNTLNDCDKGLYIMGQKKSDGSMAAVTLASMSMKGTHDRIRFENLSLTSGDRFFNLKNQEFDIKELAFVNCRFDDFNGTMWYQQTNADHQQVVENLLLDGCRFINLQLGKSALFGLSNKKIAPVYNWTLRNSTFHLAAFGSPLVSNLNKTDKTIRMTIENCTFASTAGGQKSWFDLNAAGSEAFNLSIRRNLFAGRAGNAVVFNIGKATSLNASDNYCTTDFNAVAWGLDGAGEAPRQTAESTSELMEDAAAGDLTIKAHNSVVYTEKIGDSYWIR